MIYGVENVSLVFGGEGNNPVLAVDTINIAIPKGQSKANEGYEATKKKEVLGAMEEEEEEEGGGGGG